VSRRERELRIRQNFLGYKLLMGTATVEEQRESDALLSETEKQYGEERASDQTKTTP